VAFLLKRKEILSIQEKRSFSIIVLEVSGGGQPGSGWIFNSQKTVLKKSNAVALQVCLHPFIQ